jgi:hypothetical protein
MIDPTTLDFNTFQGVSIPSNSVEQKSSILPTFLIVFIIFAFAAGVHLYVERHYSNDINE